MKSIIEEIYLGNSGCVGTVKMSDEYWKINYTVSEMTEEFKKMFNEEQQQKFLKFCDTYNLLSAETALSHYKEGFKLGLLLAIECFNDL
ncbi:MAG: hypothetical protein K2N17_06305 [Clostridia bacterium]|nr:hypothetical protein [Clostridia bacterium]